MFASGSSRVRRQTLIVTGSNPLAETGYVRCGPEDEKKGGRDRTHGPLNLRDLEAGRMNADPFRLETPVLARHRCR